MAEEAVAFNPKEFVPDLVELDLHSLGLEVRQDGVNWGEAAITAQMVRLAEGEESSMGHREGVQIRVPLRVREEGAVSLAEAAHRLQAACGRIQSFGGWIRRDFADAGGFAGSIGYKILRHTLSISGLEGWLFAHRQDAPDVVITATRWPIGYRTDERENGPYKSVAGDRHLILTEPASVGSVEGLWRGRVTNEGEEDLRGLIYSRECEYAPEDLEDPTAQPHYLAADLTPKGGAVVVSGYVEHSSLTAGWLAILGSEIKGVGHMTHQGPRRHWLRIANPEPEKEVQVQLLGRALGASRWDESLPIVTLPAVSGWIPVDLGLLRAQAAELGLERMEWKLIARAPGGAGKIRIRDVYPLSTEQWGVVTEPYVPPNAEAQSSKSPGTVEDKEGVGTQKWEEAGEAKTSNNLYAQCALERGRESHYLKASKFGFALPESARVVGIVASIERSSSKKSGTGYSIRDRHVRIVKGGAVQEAVDKAMPVQWPTADAVQIYGASNDTWGQDWTASDINNAGFGVALAAVGELDTTATAKVDAITLTVYYAEPEDEDRVCFTSRSVELRSNGIVRQHPTDDVWGALVPKGFYPVLPAGASRGNRRARSSSPAPGTSMSCPTASSLRP